MKSRQKKIISYLLCVLFCVSLAMFLSLSFITNEVFASNGTGGPSGGTGVTLKNPLCGGDTTGGCTIEKILDGIAKYLITLGGVIVVIMILIGAFQIMTAGGDPEKVKTGRHTILWSVVGFAIVLSAYGIAAIIKKLLE